MSTIFFPLLLLYGRYCEWCIVDVLDSFIFLWRASNFVPAGNQMTGNSPWFCRGLVLDFSWFVPNPGRYSLILECSLYSSSVSFWSFSGQLKQHLQQPKYGSNTSVHQQVNKEHVGYTHTHTHTHIYTMKYYSDTDMNVSLPFATIWMDLEGIMLTEISQRKKNTA